MIPHSVKGMLLNAMQGRMLNKFRSKSGSQKITIENMEEIITNELVKRGEMNTKKWLINERGFNARQVNQGLVWNKSEKGRGGSVTMRAGLKDIMDYEFYGVPKGVWPNAKRLKKWVETRVIQRDVGLRKEWLGKTPKGKDSMVDSLTYVFGRAIYNNGLQRYATIDPMNNQPTSNEEEKFYSKYDESHEPIVVYYGKAGRRQRRIVPKRRYEDEYQRMTNKEWSDMEV
jgi:hypothetical protein